MEKLKFDTRVDRIKSLDAAGQGGVQPIVAMRATSHVLFGDVNNGFKTGFPFLFLSHMTN